MAHSLSAKKRIRQAAARNMRNRSRRAEIKSQLRDVTDAMGAGNAASAEAQVKAAVKLLDREANRGLIHPNQAARRKSRLAKKLNALKQAKA